MSGEFRGGDDLWLRRVDGNLFAEEVDLAQVAAAAGTPCYLYSTAYIQAAADAWLRAFPPPHQPCYAVKANDHPQLLRLLAARGFGFDVVSGHELARVRQVAPQAPVVFSGVGKTDDELRQALGANLHSLNVESLAELEALARLRAETGQAARVMLRVRVGIEAGGHRHLVTAAEDSKFGLSPAEIAPALQLCAKAAGLECVGLAVHLGSQLASPELFVQSMQRLLALAAEAGEAAACVQCLDLGGGLGVDAEGWSFAPGQLAEALRPPLAQAEADLGRPLRLLFEPGRSLVANAGALLTGVVRTKRLGEGQDELCLVCDAGMNDYARTALYGAAPQVATLGPPPPQVPGQLAGPVCESADVFVRGQVPACAEGDLLALRGAGAYGMTMASNYNLRPLPPQVLVAGPQATLIRRRQTLQDLDATLAETPLT